VGWKIPGGVKSHVSGAGDSHFLEYAYGISTFSRGWEKGRLDCLLNCRSPKRSVVIERSNSTGKIPAGTK
jgi:hypothetical protein